MIKAVMGLVTKILRLQAYTPSFFNTNCVTPHTGKDPEPRSLSQGTAKESSNLFWLDLDV